MRFHHKPAIAAPTAPPTVEPSRESAANASSPEETERIIEEQLSHDPNDIEALRSLMEVRIKARKFREAILVLDRLIELEPEEHEWPLLKANVHSYIGEQEVARNEFEEILEKDPFRVEAYHGLVMVSSEKADENSLDDVSKRVVEAMEKCEKLGRKTDVRDFKLLVAQIRVVEGNYLEALKVYQQLAKEEPRDFRPYLCQGILYTLLGKKDEAEKHFDRFRRLVPKNHPYKEYFDDNMFATKIFSQKIERERASSRR
jgi:tetratricopeptide (TPR) repeat protein